MGEVLKLLLLFAEKRMAERGRQAAGRIGTAAACALGAAGFALAALACGLAAVWIRLVPEVGRAAAPLIVAGILLALCLAMAIAARMALRRGPPAPPQIPPVELLIGEAERLFRQHRGAALAAAVVGGLLLSRGRGRR